MNDFIKAFTLMCSKFSGEPCIQCEHDVMYIFISPDLFTDDELKQLDEWGFHSDKDELYVDGKFYSYRYGGC